MSEESPAIRINPDQVPSSIEAAALQIYAGVNDAMEELLAAPPTRRTIEFNGVPREVISEAWTAVHFDMGRQVRNSWGMWEDSPLRRDAIENYGVAHGDDVFALVMGIVCAKCRGEEWDQEAFLARITEHWAAYGETPLSAGGVK